nr:MAG TPA_asm: hypothetical protein [Bacteriophage sp.]
MPFFHSLTITLTATIPPFLICLNMFYIFLSNTAIVQCNHHAAENQRVK